MNGQELRQILREMGVKQVDLAAKMGISPQHLTSLLQAASVKISTLERIAQAAPKPNKKGGVSTPLNTTMSFAIYESPESSPQR